MAGQKFGSIPAHATNPMEHTIEDDITSLEVTGKEVADVRVEASVFFVIGKTLATSFHDLFGLCQYYSWVVLSLQHNAPITG